jgi:uncharacterized repeat protein (TIGR01451 family)
MKLHPKIIAVSAVLALLVGCATQQQTQTQTQTTAAKPAPAPKSTPPSSGYGPHYTTYEANGAKYTRGSIAYPSGMRDGSGLLLEKTVPAEVQAGVPFSYQIKVINQAPCEVRDVVITDRVTANFKESSSEPKPNSVNDGVATWKIATLGAGESATIKVNGASAEEGTVLTCGSATYTPVLCEGIKVTKAALQLVKTLPAAVSVCDPIPATFVVKNSGSSTLTMVKVTDTLPAGLKTSDGQTSLTFDAGTLAPGQSKEFKANLAAGSTGKFDNTANATCAQNVKAEAKASVTVTAPQLAITCEAPAERFAGRPIDICFTVKNTGDRAAANTIVEAPLPAGTTFSSATAGGAVSGGKIVWNVGSIAPGASTKVCVTVVLANPGSVAINGTAKSACSKDATTACNIKVLGIPAVLLEVVDVEDPIEVGKNQTYVVDVTNQGTAPATNVRLTFKLEDSQDYVSGNGPTVVSANGRTVTTAALPTLAPKVKATYRIVVKATKAGDIRFTTSLSTDQTTRPVEETESTNQY